MTFFEIVPAETQTLILFPLRLQVALVYGFFILVLSIILQLKKLYPCPIVFSSMVLCSEHPVLRRRFGMMNTCSIIVHVILLLLFLVNASLAATKTHYYFRVPHIMYEFIIQEVSSRYIIVFIIPIYVSTENHRREPRFVFQTCSCHFGRNRPRDSERNR